MPSRKSSQFERAHVIEVGAERVDHISSPNVPDAVAKELEDQTLDKFSRDFTVQFHLNHSFNSVFSLIHVDASIANAFRRILLSHLEHLAVETVYVYNNTSIIQDEVLAQRLGLIPLKGNPAGIQWLRWKKRKGEDDEDAPEDAAYDFNTVRLRLKIACKWKPGWEKKVRSGETDPDELYENHSVYARDLKFVPFGEQGTKWFTEEVGPIEPVHPDILIAKLRPGQEINMEMDAIKGTGADHAKFSPVATASYRLLPTIHITRPIVGEDAAAFEKCFPPGVIKCETITTKDAKTDPSLKDYIGEERAVVHNTFNDTVSRECLRHEEFKNKVKLGRERDHFIFSIESVGQRDSDELFLDSVRHLRDKCVRMKRCVVDLKERG